MLSSGMVAIPISWVRVTFHWRPYWNKNTSDTMMRRMSGMTNDRPGEYHFSLNDPPFEVSVFPGCRPKNHKTHGCKAPDLFRHASPSFYPRLIVGYRDAIARGERVESKRWARFLGKHARVHLRRLLKATETDPSGERPISMGLRKSPPPFFIRKAPKLLGMPNSLIQGTWQIFSGNRRRFGAVARQTVRRPT